MKEERNKRIFDLWLSCYTQEEIAEKEGIVIQTVSNLINEYFSNFGNLAETGKLLANHQIDFDPPLYNIRNKRIFDLWLSCHTQEEIAIKEGIGRKTVDDELKEFGDFSHLAESAKALASHATEFDPPPCSVVG